MDACPAILNYLTLCMRRGKSPKWDLQNTPTNYRDMFQARLSVSPPIAWWVLTPADSLDAKVWNLRSSRGWIVSLFCLKSVLTLVPNSKPSSSACELLCITASLTEIVPLLQREYNYLAKTLLPVSFWFFSSRAGILPEHTCSVVWRILGALQSYLCIQNHTVSQHALWVYQKFHKSYKQSKSYIILPSAETPFFLPARFTVSQVLFSTEKRTNWCIKRNNIHFF